jgi:hypothetical protein
MPLFNSTEGDATNAFFLHADRMLRDAQFIVDSLPNVETFSVERALRQLHAIHLVLVNLNDDWLGQNEVERLIQLVLDISGPLQEFYDTPPPPRNVGTSTIPTESPFGGRPKLDLNLAEALCLHNLGNSWGAIAEAMGVSRQTIYNHLHEAGHSSSRKQFTDITDEELDERVSAISLDHPFSGCAIIMGHLEGLGIHLPAARVQECLRRVDALGVLVRCVIWPFCSYRLADTLVDGVTSSSDEFIK